MTGTGESAGADASDGVEDAGDDEEFNLDQALREALKESGATDEEIDEFFAEQERLNEENASIIGSFTIESDSVTSIRMISGGVVGSTYQHTFTLEDNPEEYQQICDIVEGTYQYIGKENPILGGDIP